MESSFNPPKRFLSLLAALFLFPGFSSAEELTVFGISRGILMNINEADAKITMEAIFVKALVNDLQFRPDIYNEAPMISMIRDGEVGGFVVTVGRFLDMEESGIPVEGNCLNVASSDGSPFINYVLLCRKTKAEPKLADFSGKNLTVCLGDTFKIDDMWLDLELHRQGLGRSELFFNSIQHELKPSKVLIPLFFGKLDICLVHKHVWEVYSEMNPQLATQLHAIAISPPLIESVTGFNSDTVSQRIRNTVRQRFTNMHTKSDGKALLTIVKSKRFISFRNGWLDSARKLRKDHEEIFGPSAAVTSVR